MYEIIYLFHCYTQIFDPTSKGSSKYEQLITFGVLLNSFEVGCQKYKVSTKNEKQI